MAERVHRPAADAEVPQLLAHLGIPGLIDLHVHFMPAQVMDKVWAYFDAVRLQDGTQWPIHYRGDDEQRLGQLRALGVQRFTALSYAHKPGMAAWLNDWSARFAARAPGCAHSATFFPEPGVDEYLADALDAGAVVFKVHLQVGAFDPRDPLLDPVWARLSEARVPVVVHTGSAPTPGAFTGPGPFSEVLTAHPELTAVIAHMGAGEHHAYLDLALDHPNVHLDTTMAFTDFMRRIVDYDDAYLARLSDAGDRVVLGSDFPNIPYAYAHQVASLVDLGYDAAWLRGVLHDNAARLLARVER